MLRRRSRTEREMAPDGPVPTAEVRRRYGTADEKKIAAALRAPRAKLVVRSLNRGPKWVRPSKPGRRPSRQSCPIRPASGRFFTSNPWPSPRCSRNNLGRTRPSRTRLSFPLQPYWGQRLVDSGTCFLAISSLHFRVLHLFFPSHLFFSSFLLHPAFFLSFIRISNVLSFSISPPPFLMCNALVPLRSLPTWPDPEWGFIIDVADIAAKSSAPQIARGRLVTNNFAPLVPTVDAKAPRPCGPGFSGGRGPPASKKAGALTSRVRSHTTRSPCTLAGCGVSLLPDRRTGLQPGLSIGTLNPLHHAAFRGISNRRRPPPPWGSPRPSLVYGWRVGTTG